MNITKSYLKRVIAEEISKFGNGEEVEDVSAEEVDADEIADSLEKKIDYVKALKIEESRLQRRLTRIQETKKRMIKQLNKLVK